MLAKNPSLSAVAIVGVHVESDGYPNVKIRLRGVRQAIRPLTEIVFPFRRPGFERRGASYRNPLQLFAMAGRFVFSHLYALTAVARRAPLECAYVPYPSVFLLWGLSLLPKFLRPRYIVADAFISLYDTVVTDRAMLAAGSLWAKILKRVERYAYAQADLIVVDTEPNALYFAATFQLPHNKLVAIPLSIDEDSYRAVPYQIRGTRIRVLFVGTFVPLQGIETIAEAIVELRYHKEIEFLLIGDGQTASVLGQTLAAQSCPNVTWIREWQSPERIAQEIAAADVCLGIFGTGDKTTRVWPLKNYSYMAIGRALITADTACARDIAARVSAAPFLAVPPGDANALVGAIVQLSQQPELRARYAAAGRNCYEKLLSNSIGLAQLLDALKPPSVRT